MSRRKNVSNTGNVEISNIYNGKIKAENLEVEKKYESPECYYKIPADKLLNILFECSPEFKNYNKLESLFTKLKNYEDYSILNKPERKKKPKATKRTTKKQVEETEEDSHQTTPPFEEKLVNALFWIPSSGSEGYYKYMRIRLAPSNIKEAGIGAYAVDNIPKGAKGVYKGVSKEEKDTNMDCSSGVCIIKGDKSIIERINKKIITEDGRQLLI